jgi:hypothetical protein
MDTNEPHQDQEWVILVHVGRVLLKPGAWWWRRNTNHKLHHCWELQVRENSRHRRGGSVHSTPLMARVLIKEMRLEFFIRECWEKCYHQVQYRKECVVTQQRQFGVWVTHALDLTNPDSLKYKTIRAALKIAQHTKPECL